MQTISAARAAAAILTGRMALTYAHDIADGRRTLVVRPVSRTLVIDAFFTLAMVLDPNTSAAVETALNATARDTDTDTYAAIRQTLLLSSWSIALAQTKRDLHEAALAELGRPLLCKAG